MTGIDGKYIVIEGSDGTGKSTQVDLLADYFTSKGRDVSIVEEPGSDDLGKSTLVANELRKLLKNGNLERAPEINLGLFSAARRDLWLNKIKPALGRGAIVIAARNYFSTLAYQGGGEGMDQDEIMRMTSLFTDDRYMKPDIIMVLSLNHYDRQSRIAGRGELMNPDTFESRDIEFQDKVSRAYFDIAKALNLDIIDASGSPEYVHEKIIQIVKIALEQK